MRASADGLGDGQDHLDLAEPLPGFAVVARLLQGHRRLVAEGFQQPDLVAAEDPPGDIADGQHADGPGVDAQGDAQHGARVALRDLRPHHGREADPRIGEEVGRGDRPAALGGEIRDARSRRSRRQPAQNLGALARPRLEREPARLGIQRIQGRDRRITQRARALDDPLPDHLGLHRE